MIPSVSFRLTFNGGHGSNFAHWIYRVRNCFLFFCSRSFCLAHSFGLDISCQKLLCYFHLPLECAKVLNGLLFESKNTTEWKWQIYSFLVQICDRIQQNESRWVFGRIVNQICVWYKLKQGSLWLWILLDQVTYLYRGKKASEKILNIGKCIWYFLLWGQIYPI